MSADRTRDPESAPTDDDLGAFGPYALHSELGRGGQGTVYLAEDQRLGRKVALKVLTAAVAPVPEDRLRRFRREAEAASKLDHPNICAVHEAGEVDGVPYIAMRYVEGETLSHRIQQARLRAEREERERGDDDGSTSPNSRRGIANVVGLIERTASALHQAHEQGLIHRDIKPGNIMVTPDGDPVLLDFGLARDELADEHTLTHSGDLLGTPAYMSPEQLTAHRIPLDRRTDIYSLGATLYECLTLERPFTALTRAELYHQILHADPSAAGSLNRQIPRDLQVVIETAMEKDRNRRYQSALDFAEDLRRFRAFEPIRAKPIGKLLRTRRWCQRHPAFAVAISSLIVALVAAVIVLIDRQAKVESIRKGALTAAAYEAAETSSLLGLYLAREAFDPAAPTEETFSRLHEILFECREIASLSPGDERLPGPDWSAFAQDGLIVTVPKGKLAVVWREKSPGEFEKVTLKHDAKVRCVALCHGRPGKVLTGCDDGSANLWSIDGSKPERTFDPKHGLAVSTISSDGSRVLSSSFDGKAQLWDLSTGELLAVIDNGENLHAGVFHPVLRNIVLTCGFVGRAREWDLTQAVQGKLSVPRVSFDEKTLGQINHASYSPDGTKVILSCYDETATIWDRSGTRLDTLRGHTGVVTMAVYSPDGERIATASRDQTVRVWNKRGEQLMVLRGHSTQVGFVRFSPDGRLLMSFGGGVTKLWSLSPPGLTEFRGHSAQVKAVACFNERPHVVSAGQDKRVLEWNIETGEIVREYGGDHHFVKSVRISTRDDRIVTTDNTVRVFDADTGKMVYQRDRSIEYVDVRWAVFGRSSNEILLGNSPFQTQLNVPAALLIDFENKQHQEIGTRSAVGGLNRAEISPHDPNKILVSHGDTVRMYVGRDVHWEREHLSAVNAIAFSPTNPDLVLTGCADSKAYLFDTTGRLPTIEFAHGGPVLSVAFHPTQAKILTGSRDNTARIWSFDGTLLKTLRGHRGAVSTAAFVPPEGKTVVTGSFDSTVRVWILDPVALAALADQRLQTRPISRAELRRWDYLLK